MRMAGQARFDYDFKFTKNMRKISQLWIFSFLNRFRLVHTQLWPISISFPNYILFIKIPILTIFRHTYCLLYTDWLKHAITRKKPNPEWSGDGKPRIHICSKFLAQESRQRKVGIVDFRLSMSYQPSDKYAINRMAGLPLEKAVRLLFILKLKAWH